MAVVVLLKISTGIQIVSFSNFAERACSSDGARLGVESNFYGFAFCVIAFVIRLHFLLSFLHVIIRHYYFAMNIIVCILYILANALGLRWFNSPALRHIKTIKIIILVSIIFHEHIKMKIRVTHKIGHIMNQWQRVISFTDQKQLPFTDSDLRRRNSFAFRFASAILNDVQNVNSSTDRILLP